MEQGGSSSGQAPKPMICEDLQAVLVKLKKEEEIKEEEVTKEIISTIVKSKEEAARYDKPPPRWEELEELLGYKFKNLNLLEEAFTHRSQFYPMENHRSYKRLEFMGDSVLNLLLSKELYFTYPNFAPGPLTRLRSANVENERLARVAVNHGLYKYLQHKNHLLDKQLANFNESLGEYPDSIGLIDVPKYLADIVESSIGAVFIDSNFSLDIAWMVLHKLLEPIITLETMQIHPITELGEFCQKRKLKANFVSHFQRCNNTTRVDVFLNRVILVGTASGTVRKEIVQSRAAKVALDFLKRQEAYDQIMKDKAASTSN